MGLARKVRKYISVQPQKSKTRPSAARAARLTRCASPWTTPTCAGAAHPACHSAAPAAWPQSLRGLPCAACAAAADTGVGAGERREKGGGGMMSKIASAAYGQTRLQCFDVSTHVWTIFVLLAVDGGAQHFACSSHRDREKNAGWKWHDGMSSAQTNRCRRRGGETGPAQGPAQNSR